MNCSVVVRTSVLISNTGSLSVLAQWKCIFLLLCINVYFTFMYKSRPSVTTCASKQPHISTFLLFLMYVKTTNLPKCPWVGFDGAGGRAGQEPGEGLSINPWHGLAGSQHIPNLIPRISRCARITSGAVPKSSAGKESSGNSEFPSSAHWAQHPWLEPLTGCEIFLFMSGVDLGGSSGECPAQQPGTALELQVCLLPVVFFLHSHLVEPAMHDCNE